MTIAIRQVALEWIVSRRATLTELMRLKPDSEDIKAELDRIETALAIHNDPSTDWAFTHLEHGVEDADLAQVLD